MRQRGRAGGTARSDSFGARGFEENVRNASDSPSFLRDNIIRLSARSRRCGNAWRGKKKRTIFSLLGPLLNPARPARQLLGVFAPRLTTLFAEVLRRLGRERAWVVHGLAENTNGMDDISICGATTIAELQDGKITSAILDTQWLGVQRCPLDELRGGSAPENAATLEGILSGEIKGAKREMAVANAGGGFVVAGLARDMNAGIALAREQIDSGRALEKLRALQNYRPNVSVISSIEIAQERGGEFRAIHLST